MRWRLLCSRSALAGVDVTAFCRLVGPRRTGTIRDGGELSTHDRRGRLAIEQPFHSLVGRFASVDGYFQSSWYGAFASQELIPDRLPGIPAVPTCFAKVFFDYTK